MIKQFFASITQQKFTHTALIYGLQRSGTNYLQSLIEKNYRQIKFMNSEIRNQPEHKHFRLYDDKSKIPEGKFMNAIQSNDLIEFENHLKEVPDFYFVISKDPYSWYLSYLKWAQKNKWQTPNYHYIEEWNLFYSKWLNFSLDSKKIVLIRYIDLLNQPSEELNKIVQRINIPRNTKFKTSKKVYASKKFTNADQNYYKSNIYLEEYSKEALAFFNTQLNQDISHKMGYSIQK